MWKRIGLIWVAVKGDAMRLWYALWHPESPAWLKVGAGLVLFYLISPIDFIPDVVPFFGVMDDVIIVPMALRWLLSRLPQHIRDYAAAKAAGQTPPSASADTSTTSEKIVDVLEKR